jgi:hypothetical protein
LRGALPPVDLRAVCFVRAISSSGDFLEHGRFGGKSFSHTDESRRRVRKGKNSEREVGGEGGALYIGVEGSGARGRQATPGPRRFPSCDRLRSGLGCVMRSDGSCSWEKAHDPCWSPPVR